MVRFCSRRLGPKSTAGDGHGCKPPIVPQNNHSECKYTEKLFHSRFGAEKLRSEHLYQLCSYLRNLEHNAAAPDRIAEGILLYPTVGRVLDVAYRLHGHWVRIRTLDLNLPWTAIENQMLELIEP